jgi:hypothetical protein
MPDSQSPALLLLTYGKDILGLLGSILATIPFFREWMVKKDIEVANSAEVEGELTIKAFKEIAKKLASSLFGVGSDDPLLLGQAALSTS